MTSVDSRSINDLFYLSCALLILVFKFGFTFVVHGRTSKLNSSSIIFLHLSDTFISLVAFWLHGYAFAFGESNGFIGAKYFLSLEGKKPRQLRAMIGVDVCNLRVTLISQADAFSEKASHCEMICEL
ncbi:uncharacterized protein [Ambystoma mexicanum]|uniref:uncharacterized protein n=1 Tax=Ambystoma mexicanum TaxID=8296 RepID=UPI0037E90B89